MSPSLPRRNVLSGGAAIAATAVMTTTRVSGAQASEQAGTTIVRWDDKRRRWAPRPPKADFGVVFLSTNDPDAPPPRDVNCRAGDVWRRHPDAQVDDEGPEDGTDEDLS